jgi:hypothetical protein
LSDGALETCFDALADHRPLKLQMRRLAGKRACPSAWSLV